MRFDAPQIKSRKKVNFGQKLEIIRTHEAGGTINGMAKAFGMDKANLKRILGQKDDILAAIQDGMDRSRCRLTKPDSPELEKQVTTWFKDLRSRNMTVSGERLKVSLF